MNIYLDEHIHLTMASLLHGRWKKEREFTVLSSCFTSAISFIAADLPIQFEEFQ
jgi:hypothetical protein